jgi:hypothetical protein
MQDHHRRAEYRKHTEGEYQMDTARGAEDEGAGEVVTSAVRANVDVVAADNCGSIFS